MARQTAKRAQWEGAKAAFEGVDADNSGSAAGRASLLAATGRSSRTRLAVLRHLSRTNACPCGRSLDVDEIMALSESLGKSLEPDELDVVRRRPHQHQHRTHPIGRADDGVSFRACPAY
jgi:hypothetical protein